MRNPSKSWHDAKRNLRRDHRWELAELLEGSEKEKLFQEHIEQLIEKKRIQFRQLLEETTQVNNNEAFLVHLHVIRSSLHYRYP